ncbi:hypothetical protein INS49_011774 [Diaporthe citri]|uniref:uncharacterized protein n=1 Tax=Diaporthe citri TaxID=83186 RepID=UPI001C7FE2D6|nr:uncharacterized protein INS49_011774 [Diaporthe citri]KAG6360709.1 hypothetical protein INS49_011774 [Diaporthe citri]
MLPPVEEAVLQNNPEFAALYSTLTTAILNPDGTTKDDKSHVAKERGAVREELDTHRLVSAKHHLLAQTVSSAVAPEPARSTAKSATKAVPRPSELPEPLLDLLLLLPPLLTCPEEPAAETLQLLLANPPLSSLDELVPDLASLVSSNLQSSAVQISRAAFPATNPSFIHRQVPSLARRIAELSSDLQRQSDSLADARLSATGAVNQLLQKQTEILVLLIRSLEAKHGGIARSLEHRAADVSLEAQLGQANAETALWNVRKNVYSPEVREALENYSVHLRDGQLRLREAMRTAQVELQDYGVAVDGRAGDPRRERALREAARVHRETRRQIEDAQNDLSRLR